MRAPLFLLCLTVMALPALAADKTADPSQPDITPPTVVFDPDLEPQVTIKQQGEDKIEEYRIKGRLYMIKVTPPHGRPYFLVDQRGDGVFRHYDLLDPTFVVPMWVISEF